METNNNREKLAGQGRRVTLIGVWVNLFLIGFKTAGGLVGQSQALIADAVHSFSDLFTDLVVLIGLKIGAKAPDEKHPFGHARLETLASSIVGLVLITVAVGIGLDAGRSIYYHTEKHPTWPALLAAAVSIVAKEAVYQYTVFVGKRLKSPAIQANAWHHRSDAMSSVAVLAGVTGALINPAWHILDAYAALLVSFFILKVGLDVIWNSIQEFTDTAPEPAVMENIKACTRNVSGVIEVHDVRVRTSGGQYQMELHVVVDGRLSVVQGHHIAKEVERCLIDEIDGLDRIIVHVDPAEPD